MAYTQEEVNQLVKEAAAQAGGTLSYADVMNAASNLGISADQVASAMGTGVVTPSVSYTAAPDSEGAQQDGSYTINGVGVHPIYGTVAGTGGDDPNAGASSGIVGYSGGIQHIGDQDYTAQYDASGNLLGYRPYAGESFFSSTIKPLLPIAAAVLAPGLGELIGGATGLTGAGLSAATGATLGGGIAALTGQDVLKGAALGGLGGYAGSSLGDALKGAGPIDTNGWDMASAANYDAGLQGVGSNLGGLSDLQLAQMYDAGLTGVGSNVGAPATTPGYYDEITGRFIPDPNGPLQGPLDNTSGTADIPNSFYDPTTKTWTYTNPDGTIGTYVDTTSTFTPKTGAQIEAAAGAAPSSGVSASTLAKLAALAGGTAGVASLVNNQGNNTITGGGSGAGPLSGYNFDPSKFRATTPDPAMFRPGAGIVTVADMLRNQGFEQPQVERPEFAPMQPAEVQQNLMGGGIGGAASTVPTIFMAKGGSTKPTYSTKAQLAAMNPWERSVAELNNAAYAARMPTGTGVPQAGITQLGQFARGGIADLGSYSDGGRMLKGGGDGMSDSIPATIGGKQPARLADGEFVIPADVVSGLGNGSTDAGARQLYKMLDRVRKSRTGTKKQGKEIDAQKHMPA